MANYRKNSEHKGKVAAASEVNREEGGGASKTELTCLYVITACFSKGDQAHASLFKIAESDTPAQFSPKSFHPLTENHKSA